MWTPSFLPDIQTRAGISPGRLHEIGHKKYVHAISNKLANVAAVVANDTSARIPLDREAPVTDVFW